MTTIYIIAAGLTAYLLGSIPSAVWVGRLFHGIDVREHGSGNAGATNVIRVLGWKTGIPVLLFDMAKGFLAAMLPRLFNLAPTDSAMLVNLQIFTGLMAITGHIFPVFAGFRGGKGVAAMFGILLAIHPPVTLLCLGVFLVFFLSTGIVSIGSMAAGIAFPIFLLTFFKTPSVFFRIFSVVVAVALLVTHRKNIQRLLKGEEKRLFGKKKG
ncbi:MAG TPA: glycerol-3-phosphate 1-O-acyltransferase PlsY [Bacteroidales bacterium]|nr:glycerol-3-phosphate 1-O-acyltransferase PlsY [Bacteroidales bacterium]